MWFVNATPRHPCRDYDDAPLRHRRAVTTVRQFRPFHERHPTLHEAAIAVGLLLFLAFGFGWDYALAGTGVLALLYLASATIVWAQTHREQRSNNNR